MTGREYLDFDLMIVANEDGTYSATVSASPAGEAANRFEFPYGALELENYLLRFGHSRQVVRRIDSPHMEAARQFGSGLYGAAFAGEVGTAYRRSLDTAERNGKGLRLRLRLTGAPDLIGLPWEFLYDQGIGDFLVLSEKRPVVRYKEIPQPVRPLEVERPLHILLVVSNPEDHVPLDVAREHALLESSLSDLTRSDQVRLSTLETPSLSALRGALRRNQVHIIHYIGHGGFDTQTGEGVLLFEDDMGKGRRVNASSLGTILYDHDPLRLVVLNSCEGARVGSDDPFSGVAPELARRGAPAVIAMQFEVTDSAAITFAHEFYMAVADGYPVDAATAAARKAIFAEGNGLEWATPVLYLRAPDGVIFDMIDQVVVVPEPDTVPLAMEEAARAAEAGDWATAAGFYQEVLDVDPEHVEAKQGLAEAHRRIRGEEEKEEPPLPLKRWVGAGVGALAVLIIVLLVLNGGDDGTVPPPEADFDVAFLKESPSIDGNDTEWPESVTAYWTEFAAEPQDRIPDPEVQAWWMLGWNEDALYFFVEVRDPTPLSGDWHERSREEEELFNGDGINLIFGPSPEGRTPGEGIIKEEGDVMVLIGPDLREEGAWVVGEPWPAALSIQFPVDRGPTDLECELSIFEEDPTEDLNSLIQLVVVAVVPTDEGYVVEAMLPWELLLGETGEAFALDVYGTILTVADGHRNNRGSRSTVEDRGTAKHCPEDWQTLVLRTP